MGISVEQFENTPALTVDWYLELHKVELRVEKIKQDEANRK